MRAQSGWSGQGVRGTSRRSFLFATGGAVALGALAACGDGPPGASGAGHSGGHSGSGGGAVSTAPPGTIVIKNFAFDPPDITVAPGARIMVDNQDDAPHTVTAEDKVFDTGTLEGKQQGMITAPDEPGAYPYVCTLHQYMTGTLTVTA